MEKIKRLVALDVFRGMTIVLMIIVNTPGTWAHVWPPLDHSSWNGCTPTDLVFPFFLFIVGVAMWFSFRKYNHRLNAGATNRIIRRILGIFFIGLFINALSENFDLSHLRIPGVLQRIALAYGMAAIVVLLLKRNWRWALAGFILLAYWGILILFGGEHPLDLMNNLVRKIDLSVFGPDHVWHGFPLDSNNKISFDPEGILSTFPAMVNVILGYQMGEMIGTSSDHKKVSVSLFILGMVGIALGLLWNPFFPINKPIWTSSYVLYTSGFASLFLGLMLWIIDVRGWKKWAEPFLVVGMNPLFIYVLADLWTIAILHIHAGGSSLYSRIYHNIFVAIAGNNEFGSFLFALAHAVLFWLVAYIMYKKKIFIKI